MSEGKLGKLIHIGFLQQKGKGTINLFLRQDSPHEYAWYQEESPSKEQKTDLCAPSAEEALRLARREWALEGFRPLLCGFRYTLPERDEHGTNALFHQMAASYASPTGVYFDEDLGYSCVVHAASQEARSLLKRLQQDQRLY